MYKYFSDIFYSDGLLGIIGIIIAYIPVFHKTLEEEVGVVNPRARFGKILIKLFKTYPRPNGWGKLFIVLIFLYAFISYKHSIREGEKQDLFNSKLLDAENNRKLAERKREIADSIYIIRLDTFEHGRIRSDTLHSQQTTAIVRQLDKWGLAIKDTLIVRSNSFSEISIQVSEGEGGFPSNPYVELIGSDVKWYFFLTNEGNSLAKIVSIRTDMIYTISGITIVQPLTPMDVSKDMEIASQSGVQMSRIFKMNNNSPIDTMYLALKIDYTNEKGLQSKSYKNIYLFDSKFYGRRMPIVQGGEYSKFKKALISQKLW